MKNISIKRKALTCLSTAALMAAMVPGIAMAETGSKYTSDIIVNGVQDGDTVTAYELVDSVVDANNNKTNKVHDGLDGYPVDGDSAALADYVEKTDLSTLTSSSYKTLSETAKGTSVTFHGADDGAWLIVVTNAQGHSRIYKNTVVNNDAKAVGLNYTKNNATIDVKSEDANASKTINNKNVQLGQTYTFTVTCAVPSFPANAKSAYLNVKDTPDGFTDKTDTIIVKAGETQLTNGADYTVDEAGTDNPGGFTVRFTEKYIKAHPNQQLTLTYDAQLTSVNPQTGAASNHVTTDPNGYEPKVDVKTYGYEFKKTDGKAALAGAEFTLYDAQDNEVKDAQGKTVKSTSDSNGYVYFTGLADGATYTAKETKVPAGYQAAKDVTFTVNSDKDKLGNANATTTVDETNVKEGNDVVDAKQGALPTTGGAGTIGLTVAGVVLVAGGATLVLRARKNNE